MCCAVLWCAVLCCAVLYCASKSFAHIPYFRNVRWSVSAASSRLEGGLVTMPKNPRRTNATFRHQFLNFPWVVAIAKSEYSFFVLFVCKWPLCESCTILKLTIIFLLNIYHYHYSRPWVIRTDPKERGFLYVSGVKRQAGQDRHLVEDVVVTNMVANPLEALEKNVVGKTRGLTELEELEGLVKLNQTFLEDADQNASIRKSFRSGRREKKRRLMGGQQLGFHNIALLPTNDSDVLQAKETSYGMASRDEQSRFRQVKRSSIFGKNRKPTTRQKTKPQTFAPDLVPSSEGSKVVSSKVFRKTKVKISGGVLSVADEKQAPKEGKAGITSANDDFDATSTDKTSNNNTLTQKKEPLSFQDLVGAYDSSDEDWGTEIRNITRRNAKKRFFPLNHSIVDSNKMYKFVASPTQPFEVVFGINSLEVATFWNEITNERTNQPRSPSCSFREAADFLCLCSEEPTNTPEFNRRE